MADTTATKLPPLKDVVHAQSHELSTVRALLEGAAAMIVGDGLAKPPDPDAMFRVVMCARDKVGAVQDALDPYI